MEKKNFNPNEAAVANGNYFGLPYSVDEAPIVIVSAPWDVTTSYRPGTSNAPQAIIAASCQLDFFDFDVKEAWKIGIGTLPVDEEVAQLNRLTRPIAEKVIAHLENDGDPKLIAHEVAQVNQASKQLNQMIYQTTGELINNGKLVGLVGGDHSVPYGYIRALADRYSEFGILHVDAHADLRVAYEGFQFSHASIMYNVIQLPQVTKLVQVAVRDECDEEINLVNANDQIVQFDDFQLASNAFEGVTWSQQCEAIISELPSNVYVSFDIDGLSPDLCPNTGTPVPGGLSFQQAVYLVRRLVESGRKIIGFDLTEVGPGADEWDANVGARIIYKLCNLMYQSNRA